VGGAIATVLAARNKAIPSLECMELPPHLLFRRPRGHSHRRASANTAV